VVTKGSKNWKIPPPPPPKGMLADVIRRIKYISGRREKGWKLKVLTGARKRENGK
jgi:hypothetical protein